MRQATDSTDIAATDKEAPCKFCGTPTKEGVAGDAICLDCYSTQGACCSGES